MIAESCGWSRINHPRQSWEKGKQIVTGYDNLPDYLNDLNSIHQAEKMLTNDHNGYRSWVYYRNVLAKICGCHADVVHATARQKAEAFIKGMGIDES